MIKFKKIYHIAIFACFLFLCSATNHHRGTAHEEFVALDGHGDVKRGPKSGTLIKKVNPNDHNEKNLYLKIVKDAHLAPFVAELIGNGIHTNEDGEHLYFKDLSSFFENPSEMDCKLGVRTYLEDVANDKRVRPELYERYVKDAKGNKNLIKKMKAIVNEKEEMNVLDSDKDYLPITGGKKGLTKEQSMKWRDNISTTSKLGIRILAFDHVSSGTTTNVKFDVTLGEEKDAIEAFRHFVSGAELFIIQQYIDRLVQFRAAFVASDFSKNHAFIGSSLYLGHDPKNASVWMFDFGKTVPLPAGKTITHNVAWKMGNHEDGYLIGVDTLIRIFQHLKMEHAEHVHTTQ